jgi:type II secretory pathway component PulK
MSVTAYNTVSKQLVTVYTVGDPARPAAFLNVNAAVPEVLAAILDLPLDAAKQVAEKRPFNSLQDLSAAAGKEPSAFNMKPSAEAPGALPSEFTLQSRCFRIESAADLMARKADGSEYSIAHRRVEAVVVFDEVGMPQITFWSETAERAEGGKA